ncbi:hypothetical protein M885DRAFT_239313 [Pelagophyceae sp. CCMP2097]|nr:hypothetical protein M885DRAFT_239313 [Pelagophyceae sp. CCMP2097]
MYASMGQWPRLWSVSLPPELAMWSRTCALRFVALARKRTRSFGAAFAVLPPLTHLDFVSVQNELAELGALKGLGVLALELLKRLGARRLLPLARDQKAVPRRENLLHAHQRRQRRRELRPGTAVRPPVRHALAVARRHKRHAPGDELSGGNAAEIQEEEYEPHRRAAAADVRRHAPRRDCATAACEEVGFLQL